MTGASNDAAAEGGARKEQRRVKDRRGVVDRRSGMERRRGAGRRRSDDRRSAEEGEMTDEQFEFIMALDEYKSVNRRPFPTWTEVLEVIKALGYRKVADPQPLAESRRRSEKDQTKAKARRSDKRLQPVQ